MTASVSQKKNTGVRMLSSVSRINSFLCHLVIKLGNTEKVIQVGGTENKTFFCNKRGSFKRINVLPYAAKQPQMVYISLCYICVV